jgi:hypothetical protein
MRAVSEGETFGVQRSALGGAVALRFLRQPTGWLVL